MPFSEATLPTDAHVRTWRVDTAVRVFALAFVVGTTLAAGAAARVLPLIAALAVIAAIAIALGRTTVVAQWPWSPVVEALLAGILLASAVGSGPLVPYLGVPAIVAGIRHGAVAAVNAGIIATVAYTVTLVFATSPLNQLVDTLPWLVAGLGMGLLAAWQSRSIRDDVARQEPYLAAHRLLSSLSTLARAGEVGLDTRQLAEDLQSALRQETGAQQCLVLLGAEGDDLVVAASHGQADELMAVRDSLTTQLQGNVAHLPLTTSDATLGEVVLVRNGGWNAHRLDRAAGLCRDFALRLDTAALFEDVRAMATTEERNRIAREMHDGVAQELVALGYLVDEVSLVSGEKEVQDLSGHLRDELSRVVTELRYSIYDLRQHVADTRLSGALTSYIQDLAREQPFQVTLAIEVSGDPLPQRVETELLRVAQEAIGNVRKHADATHVWVTLATDGDSILLQIEDDGCGNVRPRDKHWGLLTMRERAEKVGATLSITPRPEGGTQVRLERVSPRLAGRRTR